MLGAIAGDIIGSVYEGFTMKGADFPLFVPECEFTDDTVLTVAVADSLLTGVPYVDKLHGYARAYPHRGYGGRFMEWVASGSREPYYSWGNGSAMRVSPVGWAFATLDETLAEAARSAEVTHNHPEGIKGAQATAAAMFLARQGKSKEEIHDFIQTQFGYNLNRTIESIRPGFRFEESCQGTVPEAIIAVLESTSYESAVRLAVSLGGDTDTLACIAGGIAEAFYGGVPKDIAEQAMAKLDDGLRKTVERFYEVYRISTTGWNRR